MKRRHIATAIATFFAGSYFLMSHTKLSAGMEQHTTNLDDIDLNSIPRPHLFSIPQNVEEAHRAGLLPSFDMNRFREDSKTVDVIMDAISKKHALAVCRLMSIETFDLLLPEVQTEVSKMYAHCLTKHATEFNVQDPKTKALVQHMISAAMGSEEFAWAKLPIALQTMQDLLDNVNEPIHRARLRA